MAMNILVVGSVAYDSVITNAGSRQEALGGSATYFSISCSKFAPVSVVAVVGEDFDVKHISMLQSCGVDTSGIRMVPGKTFRWSGKYKNDDMNSRTTLETQVNVLADFQPEITESERTSPILFLGNIDPEIQIKVLEQMDVRPRLVCADTMDFWIELKREALTQVVRSIDLLFIDENELRQFAAPYITGSNIVKAAEYILSLGPSVVVVKRGDHGLIQFMNDSIFAAPAYPLGTVVDPTGAGDAFAGGFIGYLASTGAITEVALRKAAIVGSVMGSFAVGSFSVDNLYGLTDRQISDRFRAFGDLIEYERLSNDEMLPVRQ